VGPDITASVTDVAEQVALQNGSVAVRNRQRPERHSRRIELDTIIAPRPSSLDFHRSTTSSTYGAIAAMRDIVLIDWQVK